MPTRYHSSVTLTRTFTFDAPEGMSRDDVYTLLEGQAAKLLESQDPKCRIEDSFEVTLEKVHKAPKRILRVNDARNALTDEETLWADAPEAKE